MSHRSRRKFLLEAQAAVFVAAVSARHLFASDKNELVLQSPGLNLGVKVGINSSGRLSYSVTERGVEVLALSPLGLIVDGSDLGQGCQITGPPTIKTIDETYKTLGKHTHARNHAREMIVPLKKGDKQFALVLRAYDDGMAVRFLLPAGAQRIDGEATGWQLSGTPEKIVWAENDGSYEGLSHAAPLDAMPENTTVLGPITVQTAHHYLSISEADCENFSDMSVKRKGNLLMAQFALEPKGWDIQASIKDARPSVLHGTYHGQSASPWRTLVVARDLNALVNSDLITNLCPPPPSNLNFDWVQPGRALWSWWSVGYPSFNETKEWYDAAAQLKWEFYVIDAGWKKWNDQDKDPWALLKDLAEYGNSKGVKTIVWGHYKEMSSPKERRQWLENAKAAGVAGVKLDFPPKAIASIMNWWYTGTLQDCAELKLLVDFHGSVKPTGLERTYPNGLTREAIRGNEYNIKRYKRVAPASEDVTLPFGRLLAGAGDLTPVILNPEELAPSGFTWCHELAQAVVVLSPITVFADHYKYYLESPFKDLLQEIPVVWDETLVLPITTISEIVAYARRKGNDWWIGIINGSTDREIKLPLNFLQSSGEATLLFDEPAKDTAVIRQKKAVKKTDVVTIKLKPGGGSVIRITATS